jgi:hypothetical protein
MADTTVHVDLTGTTGTIGTTGRSDTVLVEHPTHVADPDDVPVKTTMMYFDNDDSTPMVCWTLDAKQPRHAQLLTSVERWRRMEGQTTQQTVHMLVKSANQDGHCRTSDWLPMRRPRILLVNSPYMGGLRGTSLESHDGGWLTMGFSQVSCFHKPYRFWDLPGEDSNRGKHAKHAKHASGDDTED